MTTLLGINVDAFQSEGICASNGSKLRVDDAQVFSDGNNVTVATGLTFTSSSAVLNNVTSTTRRGSIASGYAINLSGGSNDLVITNSRLGDSQTPIGLLANGSTVKIASSALSPTGNGIATCIDSREHDLAALDANCQPI